MLAALRSGRPELIAKYDDLLMPEIEGRLLTLSRSLDNLPQPKAPALPADDKAKRLASLLTEGQPQDIAIPIADELLFIFISPGLSIDKATAYLAQDVPKRPTFPELSGRSGDV